MQHWMSEEQTYTVIVPINEMFIYMLSLVFGIISTGKKNKTKNLGNPEEVLIMVVQSLWGYLNFPTSCFSIWQFAHMQHNELHQFIEARAAEEK